MIRRRISLFIVLAGLIATVACGSTASTTVELAPTVYFVPTTPDIEHLPTLPSPTSQAQLTTVLLLGIDRRSTGGTNNTDAIIVLRLDPQAQAITMLSIPRDLYIDIPGHGQGRVNTAYSWGKRDGTGGLMLARQSVSAAIGVPIDHTVLVDFKAFVTLIDAIDGIDVDVPYAISDPDFPDSGIGYDPFYLSAGRHHLDGATALKYARTRATSGGDFDRTARQRQIVLAVRDRVVDLNLLPGLIQQSPQLWASLKDAVESDLTLAEMVELAIAASQISSDRIRSGAIDKPCTTSWVTPSGAQVLLPQQDKIDALVADLFPPSTSASAQRP